MKIDKRFALALTVGLFVASAFSLADAPISSWVGKKVMPARPGQDITVNPHADDQGAAFSFSNYLGPFTVRGEHDDRIRIFDGHREGWTYKSDFVLLRVEPTDALALYKRGLTWYDKKQYDRAIGDYDAAIRLDPRCAAAFNTLALLKARCPDSRYRDGKKAVELARKACELAGWNEPEYMDTLGAAYAEVGDFGAAIQWAKKALTFADYKQDYSERVQEDINGYQRKEASRREQRIVRRAIRYDVGDGELYRKELAGLGIILAVPETDAKGNRHYRFYCDLTHLPAKGKIEDPGALRHTFWEDTNPATVRLLARALRISPPSEFIAFLPPRLEEEMLKMELAFKHVKSEELIKKTVFDVVATPGGYKVIVRSQELRSKARTTPK